MACSLSISACGRKGWRLFNVLWPVAVFEQWRADKSLSIGWLGERLKERRLKDCRIMVWQEGWYPL